MMSTGMEDKDNSYRYVIVACSFATMFFCPATAYANGIVFTNLKATGLYDSNTLAWVMAVTQFMQAMGGPVGSVLISLTSCRTVVILAGLVTLIGFGLSSIVTDIRVLFAAYGVVLGVGRGMAFTATNVNLGFWFKENSSVASGLTFAGVAIGMLVHPRLIQAFVDWYGVSSALMLMGAIVFHACVCGMLLRTSQFEIRRRSTVKYEKCSRKGDNFKTSFLHVLKHFKTAILTNTTFLWFLLGVCLFDMAFQTIMIFLPDFYHSNGSTRQEAALAASTTGVGSLMSRLLSGIIANDPKIGTILLFSGNCGLCAILSLFVSTLVQSQAGRFLYAFSIGTYLTCIFVLLGPTALQKVGLDDLPYGFAFILFSMGIADLIAPPLAMQVRNLTGSYYAVFIFDACMLFGASLCGFLSEMYKKTSDIATASPVEKELLPITLVIEEVEDIPDEEPTHLESKLNENKTN